MTENDLKWLAAAGATEVDIPAAKLNGVALWWAYEVSLNPDTQAIKVDDQGDLLIMLNDDYHPPGWYYYRKFSVTEDAAQQLVTERLGTVVKIPIKVALSKRIIQS